MFESGAFVADHVSPLRESQVQPNGVDLTIARVEEPIDAGHIGRGGKTIGDRQEIPPSAVSDAESTYYLPPGAYVVRYGETVRVPSNHIGFILPRSSLMRNGAMLHSAVWDAGYEGQGEGLLTVHHDIEIAQDARIGQFILAKANHQGTYDGDYQGEQAPN